MTLVRHRSPRSDQVVPRGAGRRRSRRARRGGRRRRPARTERSRQDHHADDAARHHRSRRRRDRAPRPLAAQGAFESTGAGQLHGELRLVAGRPAREAVPVGVRRPLRGAAVPSDGDARAVPRRPPVRSQDDAPVQRSADPREPGEGAAQPASSVGARRAHGLARPRGRSGRAARTDGGAGARRVHDPHDFAQHVRDRAALSSRDLHRGGRTVADGPPAEIAARYGRDDLEGTFLSIAEEARR